MIGAIVATHHTRVIGRKNGEIPWRHKGDQKLFKELTMGGTVVMGRVTWEGIPDKFKPLSGRRNVIISTTMTNSSHNVDLDVDIQDGIDMFAARNLYEEGGQWHAYDGKNVWFIGGRRVYEEGLQYCDKIHMTTVPDQVEPSDDLVHLPEGFGLGHEWSRLRYTHPYNKELWVVEHTRKKDEDTDG